MPFLNEERNIYRQNLIVPENSTDLYREMKLSRFQQTQVEVSASQLVELGCPYEVTWEMGYVYLLTWIHIRFHHPLNAMAPTEITTWARNYKGPRIYRDFATRDGQDRLAAEMSTVWVLANAKTHRIENPKDAPFTVPMYPEGRLGIEDARKIKMPGEMLRIGERKVRFTDIDFNGHIGNSVYCDIFCDESGFDFSRFRLQDFQINYRHETFLDDVLELHGVIQEENGLPVAYLSGSVDGNSCFDCRGQGIHRE